MSRLGRYLDWMRAESARWQSLERLRARFPDATIEDGVHIVNPDRLELEGAAIIQAGCHIHCGGMEWTRGEGHVRIGHKTVVGPHCVLWGGGGIDIGPGCFLAPGVMVFSSQELFEVSRRDPEAAHKFGRVTMGRESRAGAQAVLGPGATLEPESVLAGMSYLMTTVPSRKMYGGIPAEELRDLREFRHTLEPHERGEEPAS